jgi:hypothetical protein
MHRGRCRHDLPIALQAMGDLAGSPGRVLVAHSYDLRLYSGRTAPRHPLRAAGLIRKLSIAGLPPPQPFVAHVRTDPEPAAELPAVRSFLQSKSHELTSLIHY